MNKVLLVLILYSVVDCIYSKQNIYQLFIEGVKEAMKMLLQIAPPLFALMFFVGILESSKLLSLFPETHLPKDIYLMGILRPVSSQSTLVLLDKIYRLFGVDHPYAILASIIQSGSDTTFYVVSLYYALLDISSRNSLCIGLFLDFCAFLGAICVYYYFLV